MKLVEIIQQWVLEVIKTLRKYACSFTINTTASNNAAVGSRSTLQSNTTGATNTAIGNDCLRNNTTASNNAAGGYRFRRKYDRSF